MIARRQALGLFASAVLVGCDERQVAAHKDDADPLMALREDGADPPALVIGITPSRGKDTHTRLEPLFDYLTHALGKGVTGVTADSYEHLAQLVERAEVDIGVFSPNAYVSARKRLPAVAIATATRGGSPTYLGYIVALARDRRLGLSDLRGTHIAWVQKDSASGYVYPRAMLRSKGIDPDTFFGKQTFADDHENAVRQVIEGEADCAAAASPFVNLDTKTTVRGADELTVVAKTKRIPLDCLVVHKRLARGLAERLRAALFELVHAGGTSDKLDDSWGLDGFVQPMHESYDEVEQVERMLDG